LDFRKHKSREFLIRIFNTPLQPLSTVLYRLVTTQVRAVINQPGDVYIANSAVAVNVLAQKSINTEPGSHSLLTERLPTNMPFARLYHKNAVIQPPPPIRAHKKVRFKIQEKLTRLALTAFQRQPKRINFHYSAKTESSQFFLAQNLLSRRNKNPNFVIY
jgi:hypothetical protein